MKNFSNTYIYIYASALVVAIALILSVCAIKLQPFQTENKNKEKMQGILKAAHSDKLKSDHVIANYRHYIIQELTLDKNGTITDEYRHGKMIKGAEENRAFNLNIKAELSRIAKNEAGKLGVFVFKNATEKTYIIPIYGKGLWGPLWGNIAIAADGNTI